MEMGLWDFTPGSVLLLSGIVGGNLAVTLNLGLVGMVLVTIGTAMILTVINCLVLQYTKIPPMIASCGVLMVYETLAAVLFNGTYAMNRSWSFLGARRGHISSSWCAWQYAYLSTRKRHLAIMFAR